MPSVVAEHRVLVLSGGVGGAKLALGLSKIVAAERLMIVANIGDDFEHLGLYVSPDLDTLLYTLAGINDPDRGWGRAQESWNFMSSLQDLGGECWFQLGDRDLALHVERTRRLAAGQSLSSVTAGLCRRLGVTSLLAPMSDDPVRTLVSTPVGTLGLQQYFVRDRCEPKVTRFRYEGAEVAEPSPGFRRALRDPRLAAIVICPSNPFISIDPILALPGVHSALRSSPAPVIAVSPIVDGKALKGPTAKMMAEQEMPVTAAAVACHYGNLLDGFVLDISDAADSPGLESCGIRCCASPSVMDTLEDKVNLASAVLEFAGQFSRD